MGLNKTVHILPLPLYIPKKRVFFQKFVFSYMEKFNLLK